MRMLSGFGFFPGAGLLPRVNLSISAPPARRDGFLWVISVLSTFRRPCVTADPLFNSEKTASSPPAGADGTGSALTSNTGGGPGGGGGGGGGGLADAVVGAGEVAIDFRASCAGTPLAFHMIPEGKFCLA